MAPVNHSSEVAVGQTDATALATTRPLTADQWLSNVANGSTVGPPKREFVQVDGSSNDPIPPLAMQRQLIIDKQIDAGICDPKVGGAIIGALGVGGVYSYQHVFNKPVTSVRTPLGSLVMAETGSYIMDKAFFHDDIQNTASFDDVAITPLISLAVKGGMFKRAAIALGVHLAFKLYDHWTQPHLITDPHEEALTNVPTSQTNKFKNPADLITGKQEPPLLAVPLPKGVLPYATFGAQERAIQDDNAMRQFYNMPRGAFPQAGDHPLALPPGVIAGDKSVAPPNSQSAQHIPQGNDAASLLNEYGIKLK